MSAAATPPPGPSPETLVLVPSDFGPGAKVAVDTSLKLQGLPIFLRVFKGAKLGGQPLLFALGAVIPEDDADKAASDFSVMVTEMGLKSGRAEFANAWGAEFVLGTNTSSHGKSKLVIEKTVVGLSVRLGPDAFRLPVTFVTNVGTLKLAIAVAQADRAVGIIELAAPYGKKLAGGQVDRIVSDEKQHLRVAFTVANTAPPTITGTPQQGQTLSVNIGAWTGAPSAFAYAWSRCDTTGNACAPIAGATASSYVPGPADTGATIRVGVSASNSVSSLLATSPPTVAIV